MSEEKKPERLDKAAIQALFQASPFISSLDLEVLGASRVQEGREVKEKNIVWGE